MGSDNRTENSAEVVAETDPRATPDRMDGQPFKLHGTRAAEDAEIGDRAHIPSPHVAVSVLLEARIMHGITRLEVFRL